MKKDIKQHVTDTIIAQIEAGTPPWRQPWTGKGGGARLPLRHNGEKYRGINVLLLWASAMTQEFTSAHWMTFRQAKELGGCVRKGQKATRSIYYGTYERETDGEPETQTSHYAKAFSVFNADQIDGLPEAYYIRQEAAKDLGTQQVPEAKAFFERTGAQVVTSDKPRAYYDIKRDHIHMPPVETFHTPNGHLATLAHEIVHWSGASHRLDRFERFNTKTEYAFEELIAEIGSCLISVELGIEPDFEQSAAYFEGWAKAMKEDTNMIFRAASEAQKAVDFITNAAIVSDQAA